MRKVINDIQPFCGIKYAREKVGDIGPCLSQPYDVITPAQQDAYYQQHPNNIIRLILNKIDPEDNDTNNRYTRTKAILDQWLTEGILRETRREGFYVYEQAFDIPDIGRKKVKGFIGKVRLRDYNEHAILPHEKILAKPLEDRFKLNSATQIQFEYIWSIYQDKSYTIDNILDEVEQKEELVIDYLEESINVRHKMWRLTDAERCAIISRELRDKTLYIADGHHRYQTMLNYRDAMRKKHPEAGPDAPWEFMPMFLVNTEHEGLTILPTHRLLYGLEMPNWRDLSLSINEHFHIKSFRFNADTEPLVRRKFLRSLRNYESDEHSFGAYIHGSDRYFLLTLKSSEAYEEMVHVNASSDWKRLDVNILNNLLINHILGITEEQLSQQTNVTYTKNTDEALETVHNGECQVALLLNATKLGEVLTIADNNEKMPRKSTHFYPKPITGLVMYSMRQH